MGNLADLATRRCLNGASFRCKDLDRAVLRWWRRTEECLGNFLRSSSLHATQWDWLTICLNSWLVEMMYRFILIPESELKANHKRLYNVLFNPISKMYEVLLWTNKKGRLGSLCYAVLFIKYASLAFTLQQMTSILFDMYWNKNLDTVFYFNFEGCLEIRYFFKYCQCGSVRSEAQLASVA